MADKQDPQAPYATNWDTISQSNPPATNAPSGDLPPVQPPSAGFIVQLFLVPALIVVVLVGVWALFGKLASGNQDWRQLVADLKVENEHRRWRAAHGLAQMLNADLQQGEDGEQLSRNPEIARSLADLLAAELDRKSAVTEEALNQRIFLTRALGLSDVQEIVLPVLHQTIQPDQPEEIRKMGLASISLIAGRALETEQPLRDSTTVEKLVAVTQEEHNLLREMATYALGLIPTPEARQRLSVLLENPDSSTRINAAIGFARQDSLEGFTIFTEALQEMGADPKSRWQELPPNELEETRVRDFLVLKNVIQALTDLQNQLSTEQKGEISALLEPIAENYPEERVRLDAGELRRQLGA